MLSLQSDKDPSFDPSGYSIFPETRQIADAAATYTFAKEGGHWQAEVKKSEYFSPPLTGLTLVLADKGGKVPITVSWKSE